MSWAVLLLGLVATAPARAEAPPKRSEAVKELIREARAALDRSDLAQARELWGVAYDIERSNVAMCNLGQLDVRMGRWEEAVGELSQCVQHMPAPSTEEERRLVEYRHADLARARRRVGEVVLMPPPGIVGMFVNGRGVKDGNRVYVRPGQHEVMAVGQEGQVARAGVRVEAGESKAVPLTFDKPAQAPEDRAQPPKDRAQPPKGASGPGAPGPAAPKGPPQGAGRPGPDFRIVTTGAVASIGFLVAGTVSLQSARGYGQEATAARYHALVMSKLDPAFQPDYNGMVDTAASGKLMRLLGTSALIAGAAAGAATLVYVWLPNDTQIRVAAHGAEVRVRW
ncbi:tetratricopeptide repeat protein [Sorangium sp. So ce426]|uniref:tetratricopeptide repeat protein n=1 Tax=Sorangium sp. So ce426 TaxID=3133312 RepID=UPI003F5BE45F